MIIRSWLAGVVLSGFILVSGSAWARSSAIEGTVNDPKGRPVSGAEIRIEARSGSKLNTVAKTDAKGHYISSDLPSGTYRVTLVVGGAVKASINNTTVKSANATHLNFDLNPATASSTAH